MSDRRIGSALAAAVLAATGVGCASASAKSNKSAEYSKKLDRTLIVFPMDEKLKVYEQMFHERLIGELEKRGVAATFAQLTGNLDLLEASPIDKQAKDFNASTALFLRRASGVVNSSGAIVSARFDAQIFELDSKKRVWRASIDYRAGGSLNTDSARVDALVGELVKALATDGLL